MFDKQLVNQIIQFKLTGERPSGSQTARWRFMKHYEGREWTVASNRLFYEGREVIAAEDIIPLLTDLYKDPEFTANGRDKLSYRVHQLYHGISRTQVMEFLKNVEARQLHLKPTIEKVNKPIVTKGPLVRWTADLIDMHKLAAFNNNHKYVLNIIDSFSKYLWSIPLKTKGATQISKEFEQIFEKEAPNILAMDNSKEF